MICKARQELCTRGPLLHPDSLLRSAGGLALVRSQPLVRPSRLLYVQTCKPFRMRIYEKCARKSFGMRTYKIVGFKVPWNDTVPKNAGGVPPLFSSFLPPLLAPCLLPLGAFRYAQPCGPLPARRLRLWRTPTADTAKEIP